MARHRIKRILQTFCCPQEKARPTANLTPHRWRIPAYTEDVNGQVEGLIAVLFIQVVY
jgi:hypothetical protein